MSEDPSAQAQRRASLLDNEANRCFVCGPNNPIGLRLKFHLDGDVCRAEFTPRPEHMGYDNVTHGGIVFSLLDDVMANWLFLRGEKTFTASADIRYRAPLPIGTSVRLEGECVKRRGRLAQMRGRVLDQSSGQPYAEATAKFMLALD